ncbi:NUDIX domain-containing protein [Actinokineospora globicatena]|uniref:NUDIX domain-containing protein n=1 Tax=Actinokineospora globicatena TaxID=103729 RepID=UPI0031DCD1D6|nr:hypothetical protein Aglo01_39270 [Actinokineospora globicatena]GLW86145.1 hypothetical protein Aglo02_37840 [Actinokineospora globicatena]
MIDQKTVDAAVVDAGLALAEFEGARAWLRDRPRLVDPVAAEVWVVDPGFGHVVLVRHHTRGWVPPGGTVEAGEVPRVAAKRELAEEAGVVAELLPVPAAVSVRSFRADYAPTLSLSYGAIVPLDTPLGGETGQPARWHDLDEVWDSMFPQDRDRIRAYVRWLAEQAV